MAQAKTYPKPKCKNYQSLDKGLRFGDLLFCMLKIPCITHRDFPKCLLLKLFWRITPNKFAQPDSGLLATPDKKCLYIFECYYLKLILLHFTIYHWNNGF
ncbi:hypothetical protein CHS0354_021188 [Potamilus streckersoni]|uniref:Uncharacterized protein n=1 Tax=Potamilus streckersoni TaxID=2493646 RepID=A0AAE0TB99_9BIVA|nr:hypothetical protein CHS0354_021188 [Potamilus streckersoni]